MRFLLVLLAAVLCRAAGNGAPTPVLAELFTSEGCSSCPPADALLMKLDEAQPVPGARVIVLSEHVDYWNHLGWQDPFSSALFSRRQSMFARLLSSEVYTPQMVIDGREQVLGNDPRSVAAAIARAAARPKTVLTLANAARDGAEVSVRVTAPQLEKGKGEVWVAGAAESAESSVKGGENGGRRLRHVAVVRSLAKAGAVSQAEAFDKPVHVKISPGASRVVAFVTDARGQVIAIESLSVP